VLAAQFNSFRDPFVILAGSVPLALFGALIFTFLKFAGPPGMHFKLAEGWTTTLNIYSPVADLSAAAFSAARWALRAALAWARASSSAMAARVARPPIMKPRKKPRQSIAGM